MVPRSLGSRPTLPCFFRCWQRGAARQRRRAWSLLSPGRTGAAGAPSFDNHGFAHGHYFSPLLLDSWSHPSPQNRRAAHWAQPWQGSCMDTFVAGERMAPGCSRWTESTYVRGSKPRPPRSQRRQQFPLGGGLRGGRGPHRVHIPPRNPGPRGIHRKFPVRTRR